MAIDLIDALMAAEDSGGTTVLRLLGEPCVVSAGRRVDIPEGSKRLLVYVALYGRVDRRRAAGTLWISGCDARAAGNLRSALWRLNRAGLDLLETDRSCLALCDGVVVDSQLVGRWATRLLTGATRAGDLDVLPAAIDGLELLPGWYDDWALQERERLRQRTLHGLEALSRLLVSRRRWAEAVECAMAAVTAEPLRESAQRVLIEAHLAEGNWVEGRRSLERYRATLHAEIGIEPDETLEALLRERATPVGVRRLPAQRLSATHNAADR